MDKERKEGVSDDSHYFFEVSGLDSRQTQLSTAQEPTSRQAATLLTGVALKFESRGTGMHVILGESDSPVVGCGDVLSEAYRNILGI